MVRKTILANGVKIVSKKMPYARSVSMGVWVSVGARDESESESGLSHFIEHMIFKGTARRSAFQIAKEFDAIGGQTNAFTSMEHTCYHARVIDSQVETMVEILSDIFLNSLFDPAEVERERPIICQEIGMVEDSPEEYVHVLSGRNLWGNHPLGRSILGSRENVIRFDASTIKSFFRRFYHPERIIISVAGNVDHQRFVELVGPAFETIAPSGSLPARTTPVVKARVRTHRRELEQEHICLSTPGLSVTDSKRFVFCLLNTILGGNMSSRLFQQIREQRGLAYSVYSFMSSHVDTGMFGIYTGVDPRYTMEAVDLMVASLRRLKAEHVSADELKDAKEFTKGNLLLAAESVDNQMVRLAQNEYHFQRFIPINQVVEQIDAVTSEHIMDLARHLFQAEQIALTLLGPAPDDGKLRNSLESV